MQAYLILFDCHSQFMRKFRKTTMKMQNDFNKKAMFAFFEFVICLYVSSR